MYIPNTLLIGSIKKFQDRPIFLLSIPSGVKKIFILILLLVLAGFLRFHNFEQRIGLWGDIARDYMIGRHIVFYGDRPVLGHYASGLYAPFHYPPYLYYFVAFLIRIKDSLIFTTAVFTCIHLIGILFYFLLIEEITDSKIAFISSFLYSICNVTIARDISMLSAYNSVPLCIMGIYITVLGIKNNSFIKQIIGIVVLLFASTLFLGNLVVISYILPFIFIKMKKKLYLLLSFCTGIIFTLFILFLPVYKAYTINSFISLLTPQHNLSLHFDLTDRIQTLLSIYSYNFVGLMGSYIPTFVILSLYVFVLFLFSLNRKHILHFLLICGLFLYFLLLSLLKNRELMPHYFVLSDPVVFILFAYTIATCWRNYKGIVLRISFILCLLFFSYFFAQKFIYVQPQQGDYLESLSLYKSAIKEFGSDLMIYKYRPDSRFYESLTYWYFFEQNTSKQYFYIDDYSNLQLINTLPKTKILICEVQYKECRNASFAVESSYKLLSKRNYNSYLIMYVFQRNLLI
jgi:hypothetical protein